MFMVLVDAHSKWLEVEVVASATSQATMQKLRAIFATHGLPEVLVSDNGSVFTSEEFRTFLARNGIQHVTSAPYHPSSNGLAERAVQTFKRGMERSHSKEDIQTRISRFLFHYRITPHSVTGIPPAELLMKRSLRTHLHCVKPDLNKAIYDKQYRRQVTQSTRCRKPSWEKGEKVYIRNFPANKPKWIPGIIISVKGESQAEVQLSSGKTVVRHFDHIKDRYCEHQESIPSDAVDPPIRRSTRMRTEPLRYPN